MHAISPFFYNKLYLSSLKIRALINKENEGSHYMQLPHGAESSLRS
jgi:hypothetical protein